MNKGFTAILLVGILGLALLPSARAATFYAGTGSTCTDVNDHSSIDAALLAAGFSPGPDEVRLTRTLSYTNLVLTLTDFDPDSSGAVTIAGGYDNCDDSTPSGRIQLHGAPGNSVVYVNTSAQTASIVTLRSLELLDAEFRGLSVGQGGDVTLENTSIHDNGGGGAFVTTGGSLTIDATSEIRDHLLVDSNYGGGINCHGANSQVELHGKLLRNRAPSGGNLYIANGCVVVAHGGAVIEGHFNQTIADATKGGGAFVENGTLLAFGDDQRILFRGHQVFLGDGLGGAIFASGPDATVYLLNTALDDNHSSYSGAAIYAEYEALVIMDRVAGCPFIFSCSQVSNNSVITNFERTRGEVVHADNAMVRLLRTVIVDNGGYGDAPNARLLAAANGGTLELDGVLLARNATHFQFGATGGASIAGQYLTSANNYNETVEPAVDSWVARADGGSIKFYSSIFQQSQGFYAINGGTVFADCLLVDNAAGLTNGYWVALAQFANPGSGDYRQLPTSWGVDFCDEAMVPWPNSLDATYEVRGLDTLDNPNGSPGIEGSASMFDIGFTEVPGVSDLIFADGFE